MEVENEENVLVSLRIIIELHKQYRPQMSSEVQKFLVLVKNIYQDLPKHMPKIFEPRPPIKVGQLTGFPFRTGVSRATDGILHRGVSS